MNVDEFELMVLQQMESNGYTTSEKKAFLEGFEQGLERSKQIMNSGYSDRYSLEQALAEAEHMKDSLENR